jgi:hypothetical protein
VKELCVPLPEFNQLYNEAKCEIQEIDVPTLKNMQQKGDDFELIAESVKVTKCNAARFLAPSTSLAEFSSVTSTRSRLTRIASRCFIAAAETAPLWQPGY